MILLDTYPHPKRSPAAGSYFASHADLPNRPISEFKAAFFVSSPGMDLIIVCSTNYLRASPNYVLCTGVVDNRIELADGVRVWDLGCRYCEARQIPSAVVPRLPLKVFPRQKLAVAHNAGANAVKMPYNLNRCGGTFGAPLPHDEGFFFHIRPDHRQWRRPAHHSGRRKNPLLILVIPLLPERAPPALRELFFYPSSERSPFSYVQRKSYAAASV